MAIQSDTPLCCRLTLCQEGQIAFTPTAFAQCKRPWLVAIAPLRLASDDFWLRHKTNQPMLYDDMQLALLDGLDEWLFFNEHDELCKGTIINLFVTCSDGKVVTPSVCSGVLLGIFRRHQISTGQCIERLVTLGDLGKCTVIMVGNAFRSALRELLFDVNA